MKQWKNVQNNKYIQEEIFVKRDNKVDEHLTNLIQKYLESCWG